MGSVPIEGLRVIQGQDLLTVYRFNTMTAEHYFCSRCGPHTQLRRLSQSCLLTDTLLRARARRPQPSDSNLRESATHRLGAVHRLLSQFSKNIRSV
jgi:hypothetical protein